MVEQFEKLGAFYLGKVVDAQRQALTDELLLYDANDLTTHGLCVGMTGSGKTGLCVSLLEEAAIDGIPAIAIDPKGDLGNLLLTFPQLRPADFRPWIDEGLAARKQLSPEQYADQTAAKWSTGLAEWGQSGERIARFRSAVDLAIYTPGSTAGLPLAVLRSFAAPPPELLDKPEALQQKISSAVSGLLALLGIDADPIQSREHILLSNLLQHAWSQQRDLEIATLIREIQSPPFSTVGIMSMEDFLPSGERAALAMRLNNLLASPGFGVWMEGDPLDARRLLWTPQGKPRLSIISIAHLSDAQRMFFVTLLLNEVLSWMRTQPGTSCLRALLYMDEVFGYFPPTANPPSKTPMLTLLKQARAYGLGVMLATQNPVDLDYKGLSNCGTWFLGRLQTERDVDRVIEGLEGACTAAGTGFNRQETEALLAGLKSRMFLMNNVHEDQPTLMQTRWAMSYLRGPLTQVQIETLMADRKQVPVQETPRRSSTPATAVAMTAAPPNARPPLPPEVPETFVPADRRLPQSGELLYRAALLGTARLHYVRAKYDVDHWASRALLAPLEDLPPSEIWEQADTLETETLELERDPPASASFAPLPPAALRAGTYASMRKALVNHLYREHDLQLWRCSDFKLVSRPGESEGDFRIRVQQAARESRDKDIQKLRRRYAPKFARLQERIRKAEARIEREQDQLKQQKLHTGVSVGKTLLGAIFGRKLASVGNVRRAASTASRAGRIAREKGDVQRAEEALQALQQQLRDLEAEFKEETTLIQESAGGAEMELEQLAIRPRKSDITVSDLTVAWTPWLVRATGRIEPLYTL